MQYGSIFVETLFGFLMLLILAKALGKTQIKQLTAFDFISALILGELVGNGLYDENVGVLEMGFAVLLWGGLIFLTELATQKFKKTRSLLEGKPSMVIHEGKLQRDEMKKAKLDINQLLNLLRGKDVFSVRDVHYAILETNGSVSVLKKSAQQQPTKKDLNISPTPVVLSFILINDGEVIKDNLFEIGKNETWLRGELKKQGVFSIEDVFYAEYVKGKDLYIQGF